MLTPSHQRVFCLVAIFNSLVAIRGIHATEVEVELVPSLSFDYVINCYYQGNRFISCSDPPRLPSAFTSSQNSATFYPGKPVSFRPIQLTSPQFPYQNFQPVPPTYPMTTPRPPVDTIPLLIPDDGRPQKPTDDQGIGCKAILSCLG